MDGRIGDVLRQIRAMGQENNTIVIFMSDNGGEAERPTTARCAVGRARCERAGCACLRDAMAGTHSRGTRGFASDADDGLSGLACCARRESHPPAAKFDGMDIAVRRGSRAPEPRTVSGATSAPENVRKAVREGDLKLVIDNGKEELHNLAGRR